MSSRDIDVTLPDRRYVVNFGANSACRLEELLNDGRSYGDVVQALTKEPRPSVRLIRAFVAAAIVSPEALSLAEVGTFIDNIGGWAMVLRWLHADQAGEEPTLPAPDPPADPAPRPGARRLRRTKAKASRV